MTMPDIFGDATYYHQERLKAAEEELKSSRRFLEREARREDAEALRLHNAEMFAWNVGTALFCAAKSMDEKVAREGRVDLVTGWTDMCLKRKADMSERAAMQRDGKARGVETLEVDGYKWRSGGARKAWLKRWEEGIRMDGLGWLQRREAVRAQDRAARILHSKISKEGLGKLCIPSSGASPRKAQTAELNAFAQDHSLGNSDLPASMESDGDDDAWSDMDSDVYEVFSEHPEGLRDSASTPGGAKVVTMVKASERPCLYTLKKGSVSQDTIRPEA